MWAFSYTPCVCVPIPQKWCMVLEEVYEKIEVKVKVDLASGVRAQGIWGAWQEN